MQRSTSPTIDLVSEKLFVDSVARGVCNGLEVAVKKIPRQLLSIEDDITKLLTQLDHENLLKIFAVDDDGTRFSPSGSTTDNFFVPGGMYRYVAMALCEAILEDYCEGKYVGPMPEDLTALNQIANGLKYIHSKGLVHGNIKPTNILISTEIPIQLKLSDFGLMEPISRQGILESIVEKKVPVAKDTNLALLALRHHRVDVSEIIRIFSANLARKPPREPPAINVLAIAAATMPFRDPPLMLFPCTVRPRPVQAFPERRPDTFVKV